MSGRPSNRLDQAVALVLAGTHTQAEAARSCGCTARGLAIRLRAKGVAPKSVGRPRIKLLDIEHPRCSVQYAGLNE